MGAVGKPDRESDGIRSGENCPDNPLRGPKPAELLDVPVIVPLVPDGVGQIFGIAPRQILFGPFVSMPAVWKFRGERQFAANADGLDPRPYRLYITNTVTS